MLKFEGYNFQLVEEQGTKTIKPIYGGPIFICPEVIYLVCKTKITHKFEENEEPKILAFDQFTTIKYHGGHDFVKGDVEEIAFLVDQASKERIKWQVEQHEKARRNDETSLGLRSAR